MLSFKVRNPCNPLSNDRKKNGLKCCFSMIHLRLLLRLFLFTYFYLLYTSIFISNAIKKYFKCNNNFKHILKIILVS